MPNNDKQNPMRGAATAPTVTYAALTGAAAAILVAAAMAILPKRVNMAATRGGIVGMVCTRTGAGDYTITFARENSPAVLFIVVPQLLGTLADADVKLFSQANTSGQLVVRVKVTVDGVATDLTAADHLFLIIHGSDSSADAAT